jgi:hypothetical protein
MRLLEENHLGVCEVQCAPHIQRARVCASRTLALLVIALPNVKHKEMKKHTSLSIDKSMELINGQVCEGVGESGGSGGVCGRAGESGGSGGVCGRAVCL